MAPENDDSRDEPGKEKDRESSDTDQSQESFKQASASQCDVPPIDFTTFVLSLSTQALMQLGEVQGPDGKTATDLMMARHSIDLLGLLEDKTKGNLTGEEERLLEQVLFDLRMRFVAKCKSKG